MTTERVYYSDAQGIRVGTRNAVFGQHTYGTRNIRSTAIASEQRRLWPGLVMMAVGLAMLGVGWFSDATSLGILGAGAFAGGSFYVTRRKPRYALQLILDRGPVFVVASRNKGYLEEIKKAVDRAIDEARAAAP